MSIERRKLLIHLGAELVLTPAAEGMKGAIARAGEMQQQTPGTWMPDQFFQPRQPGHAPADHRPEDLAAMRGSTPWSPGSAPAARRQRRGRFSEGAESGNPHRGCGAGRLAGACRQQTGPHKIQGIGAGFVPGNFERSVVDEIVAVENDEAIRQSANPSQTGRHPLRHLGRRGTWPGPCSSPPDPSFRANGSCLSCPTPASVI